MSIDKPLYNTGLAFRTRIVKLIRDNFILKGDLSSLTSVVLSEQYKTLINSINGFIVICNFVTGLYEYISDSVKSNLGFTLKDYSSEKLTDFIFSIIHEEHRIFMLSTFVPLVLKYFKENSTINTGQDYRYTCCFKLKNIQGVYHWYLIDTVILEVDGNGFPLRTLITCTNINQFKKDESVYYNIMKKNRDGMYEVMLEGTRYHSSDILNLTRREIQIINLITRGNTSKQIADKLFISFNTVQTHRKRILKKTKCAGTAELTSFAFSKGLL